MISPGSRLAHYEIVSALGKGGMGEVYRARDTILGREVAIKVLPSEFSKDVERIARLEREARTLAALNHPNIAAIHGLEESDDTRFLVLELVEGDTLADRLKHAAIPVEESLRLALQIAEALEAAHEKGVIHRDLKPANIKVTDDDRVKVLDFGLAKAFEREGPEPNLSQSPTLSMAATRQGIILGTAAYMSPEQAKGRRVDRRADVWAFGCVLYEMVTREMAFQGEDVSDILGSVLKLDPAWEALPANLNPRLREVLERCLDKTVRNRYHDIADVRVDIERILADPDGVFVHSVPEVAQATWRAKLPWVAAFVVALAVSLIVWTFRPAAEGPSTNVARFSYELPENTDRPQLGNGFFAISAAGDKIVYSTPDGLYLRSMDEWEARLIPGTEGEDSLGPFFSPDGLWIGYWAPGENQLRKVLTTGSAPVVLAEAGNPFRPSWSDSDWIYYAQNPGGIFRVSATSGEEPELVVPVDEGLAFGPVLLPDQESLLFTVGEGNDRQVVVRSLNDGNEVTLFSDATSPVEFLPSGHLVYAVLNDLFVRTFDTRTWEVGSAIPSVQNIFRLAPTSNINFDVSESGSLVYIPGPRDFVSAAPQGARVLAFVDRNGQTSVLNAGIRAYRAPRLSPDGQRLTVQSVEGDGRNLVWVYDLVDGTQILPLTQDGNNISPIWTPDGERITFASDRSGAWGIYWQDADGTGSADALWVEEDSGTVLSPHSWSPDGRTLSIGRAVASDAGVWTLEVDGEKIEPEPFYDLTDGTDQYGSMFSPDGNWVAFNSDLGGGEAGSQVWVLPFPFSGVEPTQISQLGGMSPLWSRDGAELFYRRPQFNLPGISPGLISVAVTAGDGIRWSDEDMVPIEGFVATGNLRDYDVTQDGQQFLVLLTSGSPTDNGDAELTELELRVVLNWLEEVRQGISAP